MDIVLLDGGMGQELIARAEGPPTAAWSAHALEHRPDLVEAVHRDFISAGARLHILNTYAATPERVARLRPEDDVDAIVAMLHARAIEVARAARGDADVALAGCLPPLAGSYHPEHAPDDAAMAATYARLVALQADACDLMLAETMSSVREVRAATVASRAAGARVWIAMSVSEEDGTRLRSGEALQDGVDAAIAAGAEAVLLNCSRPEAIAQGLGILAHSGLPFGAYANGFVDAAALPVGGTVQDLQRRTDLSPDAYAEIAMGWIANGATIVGGCCEVGPAHIAELARRIVAAGHRLVRP